MKTKQILSSLILTAAFLITACGGTSAPKEDEMMKRDAPTEEAMMEKETPTEEAMMEKETPTPDAMMSKETPAADLKGYAESNGFDWVYAVATAEVAQDFSKHYGDQFLNPPSTPMLVIDRKGEARPLPFGIKSADELLQFIQPFLDEAM